MQSAAGAEWGYEVYLVSQVDTKSVVEIDCQLVFDCQVDFKDVVDIDCWVVTMGVLGPDYPSCHDVRAEGPGALPPWMTH